MRDRIEDLAVRRKLLLKVLRNEAWGIYLFQNIHQWRAVMNATVNVRFERRSCRATKNDSSALEMEAAGSSELLVLINQTTRCHVPEDSNFA
jgi:hypothetical protein